MCQSILAIKKDACLTYIGFVSGMRPGLDMHGAAQSSATSLHLSVRLKLIFRAIAFFELIFRDGSRATAS